MASRVQIYTDPLQHALSPPPSPRRSCRAAGRGVIVTAVAAAFVIDIDHAVAARSVRVRGTTALVDASAHPQPASPRSAPGRLVGARPARCTAGRRSAGSPRICSTTPGDRAAPTPVLWPFGRARQLGRRVQVAGTPLLVLGSLAISRATAAAS